MCPRENERASLCLDAARASLVGLRIKRSTDGDPRRASSAQDPARPRPGTRAWGRGCRTSPRETQGAGRDHPRSGGAAPCPEARAPHGGPQLTPGTRSALRLVPGARGLRDHVTGSPGWVGPEDPAGARRRSSLTGPTGPAPPTRRPRPLSRDPSAATPGGARAHSRPRPRRRPRAPEPGRGRREGGACALETLRARPQPSGAPPPPGPALAAFSPPEASSAAWPSCHRGDCWPHLRGQNLASGDPSAPSHPTPRAGPTCASCLASERNSHSFVLLRGPLRSVALPGDTGSPGGLCPRELWLPKP